MLAKADAPGDRTLSDSDDAESFLRTGPVYFTWGPWCLKVPFHWPGLKLKVKAPLILSSAFKLLPWGPCNIMAGLVLRAVLLVLVGRMPR